MLTKVRELQFSNADAAISVTLSGMVTDAREVHHQKVCAAISVTLSGRVTVFRLEQEAKELVPMLDKLLPKETEVILEQ